MGSRRRLSLIFPSDTRTLVMGMAQGRTGLALIGVRIGAPAISVQA